MRKEIHCNVRGKTKTAGSVFKNRLLVFPAKQILKIGFSFHYSFSQLGTSSLYFKLWVNLKLYPGLEVWCFLQNLHLQIKTILWGNKTLGRPLWVMLKDPALSFSLVAWLWPFSHLSFVSTIKVLHVIPDKIKHLRKNPKQPGSYVLQWFL